MRIFGVSRDVYGSAQQGCICLGSAGAQLGAAGAAGGVSRHAYKWGQQACVYLGPAEYVCFGTVGVRMFGVSRGACG